MNVLMMTLFLILAVIHSAWFIRRRIKRNRYQQIHQTEPPASFSPGVALYISGQKTIGSKQLTATLLDFVRGGNATLHRDGPSSPVVRFEAVERPVESPSSILLFDFLFHEVGTGGVLYVEDLYTFTELDSGRNRFLEVVDEWQEQIESELSELELLDLSPLFRKIGVATHLMMLFLMAVLLFLVPLFGFFAFILTVVSFSLFLLESNLTDRGAELRAKWLGYRAYLHTMTDAEDTGADKWTAHFVYAVAFGLLTSLSRAFPIREASELSLRTDQLPIYFYAAPGTAALSAESIQMFRDVDAAFDHGIHGEAAGLDQGINDIGLSDS
ncbi:DUF2207 family protein [Salisediminibacterium selenitireducens]|uniref:Predicted membrane protein YciQ-like C-terminal domain-containing protein n=1 Tax=Bacillus selenitireducens (strain ATCC 700615 / DSM 15326 / MLS10) TaxID=439292 RepID=D6XUA2_BACIE|nr:DUF2207 domain-containing protein [Salisediminibacterium selenitireducens]ADH99388.1 hypothetical protein Bsel_1884 [[Bacillus] selenitireducens MLS10]